MNYDQASLILLVVVSALGSFFGNVASNQLPKSWEPYLRWAWVLFLLFLVAEVILSLMQHIRRRNNVKPPNDVHLDERILVTLLSYRAGHMGNHEMPLRDLFKECGGEQTSILNCLYRLKEKKWVDFHLLERGEGGQVWLTAAGVTVAEDLANR